jgi:hypothetical protein
MVPAGFATAGDWSPLTPEPTRHDGGSSLADVSTRTYIVLAGLTGLLILAAFAIQLVRT